MADSSTTHAQGPSTEGRSEPSYAVLYEDDSMLAVSKPCRLLVHRTDIDFHEPHNLRDLVNKTREKDAWLQPVHRLDKPTSGIVLFATPGDALNGLKLEFVHRRTTKVYWAVVRGWTEDEGIIEKPLPTAHNPEPKEARTAYRTLARTELAHPVGPYETARYSLVECRPETGRFHQIRLHFRHLRHPLVGDSRYGDKKHNRFVAASTGTDTLLLHAGRLEVNHPGTGRTMTVIAGVPEAWHAILDGWEWDGELLGVPRRDATFI
ncbi:MAG: pseudouridine synthase [Bacteroidetes bacterium]|nr:pseudouridine synthase [Bacteroidota bacterium]MDA0903778.1 pseudouridine synthase [Bacteroidota bacterium]MDA1242542.1 pseudouridine synthase [Bacteroidota bacterium]